MNLKPVIGLETHVQLKTRSKLFCSCSAHETASAPNTHVCPICVGHPGVLPVPNEQAVRYAILLGLALNGTITEESKFDRKNYFYPDLPKAYQISQFDLPIMQNGFLLLDVPGEAELKRVRIERLHLEEDAAKNIHTSDGKTSVDFNRGGTPLCEIVSYPDIESAAQAKAYMQAMRLMVRTLGVSDGDMEKGHMRCDVNISLREVDDNGVALSDKLHPKTEIKNVNSFKAVERAIEFEIQRQTKLWLMNTPPAVTTTRGWNDAKQQTVKHRVKEGSADYRYFPEPDIPPMYLKNLADEIRLTLPELPDSKRERFVTEYGFKPEYARQIIDDPALANFTEAAMSELGAWLQSQPDIEESSVMEQRGRLTKIFAGWLLSKLTGLMLERGIDIRTAKITPENFAEFILMIAKGEITGAKGLEILGVMLDSGADPSHVVDDLGARKMDDKMALAAIVDKIIENNTKEVERYRAGETKLIQFFLGQIMKETKGTADPMLVGDLLEKKL